MLPVGPLMIEHRLIERMIRLVEKMLESISRGSHVDLAFLDFAVDFIRTYADRCHHGKEENIFFRDLKEKKLSPVLRNILCELIEEHVRGRAIVARIEKAKVRYLGGESSALTEIISQLKELVYFYPKHIDKEDNHFFRPVMDYFSNEERENMLKEFAEFDRSLIHTKYKELVERFEAN
jgi:hemerythrin-like domain-containing protein